MKQYDFIVLTEDAGQRLDQYLSLRLPQISRSQIQILIKEQHITVNSEPSKPNHRVRQGEQISVLIPPPQKIDLSPEDIELDIVYQDNDIAVINKRQGMVVHPAAGNYTGTLVNALLYHCDDLSGINGEIRPGIVHRIDKDTSGLLVIAKNDNAHRNLADQIKKREVSRIYRAVVEGNIRMDEDSISAPIGRNPTERKKMAVIEGGRHAVTHFRVLERFGVYTYLELTLETGRTHQIRVHLSHIGHPIVGDPLYGRRKQKFNLNGQVLHAYRLSLRHPTTGEPMSFYAPLPDYFENLLTHLRNLSKNL